MLALGKQLTADQRVHKAVVDIMGKDRYVHLSGILMIGDRKVVDDIPTACTNGRDEMYGREFVDVLNDPELRFLILHESYHKLYKHLITWRWMYDESPELANIACDYVINCKIIDENGDGFAQMPSCGLFDPRYRGMNAAQVYKLLKDDDGADTGCSGDGQGGGFDDHDWDGAQELTEDEQRDLGREIDEAIRQGALVAGKLGTGGDRSLDELLPPQVDWREVLREFVQSTCTGHDYSTWARPSRRFIAANVYLPSTISERVDELVIAIDTSGSIRQRDVTTFLSEVKSICDVVHPDTVRLLYWDTEVCRDEVYNGAEIDNIVASTKPSGGGGTLIECVTEHMQDENITPQAVVVFTDGYLGGSWGTWSCPVLWCLLNNNRSVPTNGKLLRIKNL